MAIAFEITSSIAMFRRPYTTTSSVSFPFPPPTTVAGLLSGIIGLNNDSHQEAHNAKYWEQIEGTKIAVSVLNPISWFIGSLNFWNLKEPQKAPHIRVKHQFVKNPKYRLYVHGGVEEELKTHLEKETFIYTPTLGTAYAIADINYLGEFPITSVKGETAVINSVLPLLNNEDIKINVLASKKIFRDVLPFKLTGERQLLESINVLYSSPEEKLHLLSWEGLDVTNYKGESIAWFPAW